MDEMHILRGYLTGEVQQKDKRNSDINDVYVFFSFLDTIIITQGIAFDVIVNYRNALI